MSAVIVKLPGSIEFSERKLDLQTPTKPTSFEIHIENLCFETLSSASVRRNGRRTDGAMNLDPVERNRIASFGKGNMGNVGVYSEYTHPQLLT